MNGWRKASNSHTDLTGNCAEVAAWRKASTCQTGECVEVATFLIPVVVVRDSKKKGPVLTFTSDQWGALIARVKTGSRPS